MSKIDLTQYGITGTPKIIHNPSWDELYIDETNPGLTGYEKGQDTELGAVNVMTGIYTGRSPKDKFFVEDEVSKNTIWWTSDDYKNDNKPITPKTWDALKAIADKELSDKTLYVVDAFCGSNKDTRLAVRFIMEVAWQAHFVTNMFIRPTKEELENFTPDFVVMNASKAKSRELERAWHQLRDMCCLQPHRAYAGYHQHMVWRRDEERYVLNHELLSAFERDGFDALLGQHRHAG